MKRKNVTRSALFTSIISLLLCVSMLVGTTFAWFTDSVVSGNNVIAAGNLDVELAYSDKDESGYVGATTELFNDVKLWEPGAVAYVNFVVENVGTLALKYQMSVNFANETVVNGHGLSEALKVAVVEGGFSGDRAAAQALTNLAPLSSFVLDGVLEGNTKSETYGLVIYWEPTENDNWFNMNNDNKGKELKIDLGVNLFATQEMYEEDSFGEDYDENAALCKFVVTNEAELVAALAEAKNGDVIGIKGNGVTWTTGAGHGSTPFIDAGTTQITLVGLTDDATFTAIGSGVGPIGIDNGTVTFKNLKIADESVSYAENSWEFGYLEFRGNTVFENCTFVNAIMLEGDSAAFNNCSFNSNKDSEYALWVSNGDATIENSTITGTRGLKLHEAYGSEIGTVVVNNNMFIDLSKKPGMAFGDLNADTTVVVTNNTFAGTQPGDQGLYSYETDTDVATFNFEYADNIVAGFAGNVDELKQAAKEKNATVVLASGTYNMGGSFGIGEGTTLIGNGDVTINGTITNTLKNVTVKNVTVKGSNAQRWAYASGDIVFENCTFDATGVYALHFDGTTGANITYKNCTINGWAAITGGHNSLTFDGCTINGNGTYGVIRVYGDTTIKNCTFDIDNVNTTDVYQDGIHAVDCTVTVENCTNVNGAIEDIFNVSGTGVINKI